jgi:fumarylacetoacetase
VYGVFAPAGGEWRVGWRAGDVVLDLAAAGFGAAFERDSLNAFMAQGPVAWRAARERVDELVARGDHLVPLADVELRLPFEVADYVDFYSSREHATNVSRILRPGEEPLPPAWRHLPIGYHGRAGSVVVSGTEIVRPCGQRAAGDFGPTRKLDVELELGFVVGVPTRHGERVAAADFERHAFGVVVVNDWSARDLQAFEYRPLGPFLGKSFATSISAWVTPLADLEDARVPGPPQEPEPLPYLRGGGAWALDLALELEVNGAVVSRGNARTLYWSMPQQLAHATSNGAALRTGDLFASGTISGAGPGSEGSLLELSGNTSFLEDGDEVVLRAGRLAEVRGRVAPARPC